MLHLHVVLLLLLLHADRHSLLLLYDVLWWHRAPHLILRKLGDSRGKLLFRKHSGTRGPQLRASWDCGSLHVNHSLRSGMLLYVRWLRLLLVYSHGTPLLLHRPLLLVTVFGDNGRVLPLLLPQLVQNLLYIGVAGGYSLELLLIHVADVATILLNRAMFGV